MTHKKNNNPVSSERHSLKRRATAVALTAGLLLASERAVDTISDSASSGANTPYCEVPLDNYGGSVLAAEKAAHSTGHEAHIYDPTTLEEYSGSDELVPRGSYLEISNLNRNLCVKVGAMVAQRQIQK